MDATEQSRDRSNEAHTKFRPSLANNLFKFRPRSNCVYRARSRSSLDQAQFKCGSFATIIYWLTPILNELNHPRNIWSFLWVHQPLWKRMFVLSVSMFPRRLNRLPLRGSQDAPKHLLEANRIVLYRDIKNTFVYSAAPSNILVSDLLPHGCQNVSKTPLRRSQDATKHLLETNRIVLHRNIKTAVLYTAVQDNPKNLRGALKRFPDNSGRPPGPARTS